jgi:tetratricopeptide (TPR) repeat protein
LPLPSRIANALVSYVAYLGQFFYPVGLAVFYPLPQNALPVWKILGSGLLLAGISLAVLACRRKHPYCLVGWLWYLGMLVPVIGLVQVGSQAMADRYTYLTQIGLYIALAWGAERISRRWPYRRWVGGVISVLVVTNLAWCAWQQVSYWKDDETLWTHTLACTSQNCLAHNNLGNVLAGHRRVEEAIAHYRKALEINPDDVKVHNNLGAALAHGGQIEEAIAHYRRALEINPDDVEAHSNLGVALAGRGRVDEAIAHYRKALEINVDDADAHNNLGLALAGRGEVDEAMTHYRKALEIKPGLVEAHNNLGNALAGRGLVEEAIDHYRKALKIKPDDVDTHNNLALALAGRGLVDEAVAHYRKALEIRPAFAEAHINLGDALAGSGRPGEALEHYQKALDLASARDDRALAEAIRARIRLRQSVAPAGHSP